LINAMNKKVSLEYLHMTKAGAMFNNAVAILKKYQEIDAAIVKVNDEDQLIKTKVGTVLTLSILSRLSSGKSIKEFTEEDWDSILSEVEELAVGADGQSYSIMVFSVYAGYIESSVKILLMRGLSEERCNALLSLANEIRELGDNLTADEITEVDYTEKCLWLSLEAMIKLVSTYAMRLVGVDAGEFLQSVSMLAFEYGRYTLYKQEQELLDQYIQHQYEIDEDLQEKFDAFAKKMEMCQEEFRSLVRDAFDADISVRLRSSVGVARYVGVPEEEILTKISQVDEMFM